MTPTPNNTHASQLTTNEPTIRSNNSALLASNPSVVALALSTYTKPPFTAAVHKTRRQHTNCAYGNKNKLTGGVVTPRHVVPAPCGRLRREREVIVRLETLYIQLEVLHETHRGRLQLAVTAVVVLDGRHQRFHCQKTKHAVILIAHTKVKRTSPHDAKCSRSSGSQYPKSGCSPYHSGPKPSTELAMPSSPAQSPSPP